MSRARPRRGHSANGAAREDGSYPPIDDYALISDCHSMALVSRTGSIDWCCMPRVDSPSSFGRLLDWQRGGFCSIAPVDERHDAFRSYLEKTLVLSTTLSSPDGEARVLDCFTIHRGGRDQPYAQLLRVVEGVRGRVDLQLRLHARFDYGEVRPWLRYHGERLYSLIGGQNGLVVASDIELERAGQHDLERTFTVRAQERVHLSIQFVSPHELEFNFPAALEAQELDRRLDETITWWQEWSSQIRLDGAYAPGVARSAIVLKALTNAPSGAMVAAATTSLPESPGGSRNWDYRFSWIRDSSFSVRSLADIGCHREADGFRRFIERSAAGAADDLQIMYGVDGERRLTEIILPLEGYRGARPVRIGNAASTQLQLDAYGELVELSWRWHLRGHSPDDDYWRFLVELVEVAAHRWEEPDRGMWEVRGNPRHFVHSKVMCWVALDRGLKLAESCLRQAPIRRWQRIRAQIRKAVETKGYDRRQHTFVQAFGSKAVDASLLLLPTVGFVEYDDDRMVGTVAAVRARLEVDGLVLRYRSGPSADGLKGKEGSFLACTFWLAECLARQGDLDQAREVFDRVLATSNDLGLFAEEYDTRSRHMLGNFPQALTHLSHISAAVALSRAGSGTEAPADSPHT
ncbi:MAG: glycoside hydrolase family 15 protein [Candidatus Dormibacter sp.]